MWDIYENDTNQTKGKKTKNKKKPTSTSLKTYVQSYVRIDREMDRSSLLNALYAVVNDYR